VLKPGQVDLNRQDLYCKEAKAVKEPYLFQDSFPQSVYKKHISSITLPEDYADPQFAIAPPTISAHSGAGGTAHWKSEYKAAINQRDCEEAEFGKTYFFEDIVKPPSLHGVGNIGSSYQEEFGKYRTNPRDKVGKTIKKPIDAGTTKGTKHIPGYQGFIPGNTFSESVARIEEGDFNRSTDKTNIEQVYHCNVIGYSGHQPLSACNESGGRKPSTRTVYGHDFQQPEGAHLLLTKVRKTAGHAGDGASKNK